MGEGGYDSRNVGVLWKLERLRNRISLTAFRRNTFMPTA